MSSFPSIMPFHGYPPQVEAIQRVAAQAAAASGAPLGGAVVDGNAMRAQYQAIENYGLIGNLRTAALVGMDGSIDWLCLPHFDSPSVFAAILDDQKGGRFRIAPAGEDFRRKQFYWPDTAVLVTRFLDDDGVGEVEDYMPVGGSAVRWPDELVRRVRVVRGRVAFRLECRPAFDYARAAHQCISARTAPASTARG